MPDRSLLAKIFCVGLVAAFMLPAGHILFPYVSGELSGLQFKALEAVVSTTVGFGIYTFFG